MFNRKNKTNESVAAQGQTLEQQMHENRLQNLKVGNSELRMIGDKIVLIQVVKLLAYIRHALQNNLKTSINVKIGEKIANVDFKFDVNQLPIDDLITQKEIMIS